MDRAEQLGPGLGQLYPALASLGHTPPSMASFHSVLASLSAYRPEATAPQQPDYAALLRLAAAAPPTSCDSPPSPEDARARLESAHELRTKAREFELKLEAESQSVNTET